jgi:hypothetical protein
LRWSITNFLPSWSWSTVLLFSASWVCRIIGMSYCAQLLSRFYLLTGHV